MHGWPHTFALQLELADRLADWNVVVPSFPGFGSRRRTPDGPITEVRLARTMHLLMTRDARLPAVLHLRRGRLGERQRSHRRHLPRVDRGRHRDPRHFGTGEERAAYDDPAATAFFAALDAKHGPDGGYGHIQATRPDTLAAAPQRLAAGLLAWFRREARRVERRADLGARGPRSSRRR